MKVQIYQFPDVTKIPSIIIFVIQIWTISIPALPSVLIMCVIYRQTGMGFVSTMARVGSMAAPAVLILDEVTHE